MQSELALKASSHLLIVLLGIGLIVLSLVSMENRQGVPLKGVIWFALALANVCVVVLLARYVQKIVGKRPSSYRGSVGIGQRAQGEVE